MVTILVNMDVVTMTSYPVAAWQPLMEGRSGPVYRAIAAALHDDIVAGRLPPGARLPTHRDLAWRLKVTTGTITRAYQEAERQGLIGGEVGRGTFVLDPKRPLDGPPEPVEGDNLIDLSVNAAAYRADGPALRTALSSVAERSDLLELMGYNPVRGVERLRRAGATWIAHTAGYTPGEDRVLISAGGQGALAAAVGTLLRPGDAMLVEQLTYPGIKPLAAQLGVRLVPVPMDRHGLLPDAAEALAKQHGAHVLYCMPTLQNPTTVTMPVDRRQALVDVARRIGLTVIEDDVYGFLADRPLPPLAALGPDVTFYLTSISKSLFPGLRTGYIVPPAPLLDRTGAVLRAQMLVTAHVGAAAAAELIDSGEAARIAARRRALVVDRQALARGILGHAAIGHSDPACTHLWLTLPEPWRREDFARELLDRGIKVLTADAFTVARGDTPHALRVCLCAVERDEVLASALRSLAELLDRTCGTCSALV